MAERLWTTYYVHDPKQVVMEQLAAVTSKLNEEKKVMLIYLQIVETVQCLGAYTQPLYNRNGKLLSLSLLVGVLITHGKTSH